MEEFPEAAHRVKKETPNPCGEWGAEQGDPGTHIILAVFGYLIYAVNQCATAMTPANINARVKQFTVRTTYSRAKGDFQSLVKLLPTRAIQDESTKLKKANGAKKDTESSGETCKFEVENTKPTHQICSVVATLITNAKNVTNDHRANVHRYALMGALGKVEWASLNAGKIFFSDFQIQY